MTLSATITHYIVLPVLLGGMLINGFSLRYTFGVFCLVFGIGSVLAIVEGLIKRSGTNEVVQELADNTGISKEMAKAIVNGQVETREGRQTHEEDEEKEADYIS